MSATSRQVYIRASRLSAPFAFAEKIRSHTICHCLQKKHLRALRRNEHSVSSRQDFSYLYNTFRHRSYNLRMEVSKLRRHIDTLVRAPGWHQSESRHRKPVWYYSSQVLNTDGKFHNLL